MDGAAPHDATAMERVCYWPSQVARPQQTPMQTPAMESNDTMWLRDGSGLLRFDRDDIVALCDTRGVILGFAAGADLFALCEGDHVVAFWGLRLIDRFGAPWFSVACRIHVGVVRCSADVYLRTYTVQGPLRLAVVVRQQNDGLLPHDRNGSSQPPARVGDEIQGTGTAETGEI
ncbi:hypothetical protein FACS189481_1670 [Clostridia bacterium]|nr:hypothetical protein FACS189481_1670 [Clostridia bacterium]